MRSHVYCVILAGGVGERLWPLSRQEKPKQLLEVGSQTLLEATIERVESFVPREHILISTTQQHAQSIQELVHDRIGGIIVEPGLRNTGPAILLSCYEIYDKDLEAVIVFLPADSFIPQKENHTFAQFLEHALDFVAQEDRITLLGVKPTHPATGYGYIEHAAQGTQPFPVKKFHEKPSRDVAQSYLDSGSMLWNIGMFCGKASVFINEYKKTAPEMHDGLVAYRTGMMNYKDIPSDSIDYAVMEKSSNVSVLPVDFAWCDVGNIQVLLSLKEDAGSLEKNAVISTESSNNLVDVPHKLVALIGVHDLCIVETDQALLITNREDAEKVRDIVKQLKQKNLNVYL